MDQDRHKRKLTAILSADVVGYSRLMDTEESWTIKTLDENKRLISGLIEEYGGHVIDAIGDNLLAEFNSVINSVECAVKVQQELKKKNDTFVEDRRMHFRIGVNLGDVVEEDGRIYGSGVNIASRLEGLAEPGGVCISGRTYDHIKTKLGLGYKYLGEHNVKNIDEPIRIYRLLMDSENLGKVIGEKKAPSRSSFRIAITAVIILIIIVAGLLYWNTYTKDPGDLSEVVETPKTIAVLPFENISSDKDQEYFADGLSEEIINNLTKISNLNITSRTSSFAYKGTKKSIKEIAEILGREYILEGSVRKAGNALRITVQLIRAADDSHIWSEIYERELKDIFDIQEDIATRVADKLKLSLGENKSFKQLGGTDNLEAYELYLVARGQTYRQNHGKALESVNAAIALDPRFARAWTRKGMTHLFLAIYSPPDKSYLELNEGLNAALKAIELEPNLGNAYLLLGAVHVHRGEFIKAESAYRKGIELTNDLQDYRQYGLNWYYLLVGYLKKFNEKAEKYRLNDPYDSVSRAIYMFSLGIIGDMQQAEEEYERGKAIFGDQWGLGDAYITMLRLGSNSELSINDIPKAPNDAQFRQILIEHLDSPDDGLMEIRRLYNSDDNLNSNFLFAMACLATYFGDAEFAMDIVKKAYSINASGLWYVWLPVVKDVRQLPRFKEFVRKIGLVDYWKEYGWPDLCHPVGDDDFECD